MEFSLLAILTCLSLASMTTHAALSPEAYWNNALPNTPMPKALTDLLRPEGRTENYNFLSLIEESRKNNMTGYDLTQLSLYWYAATAEEVHTYQGLDLFYLERDLIKGKKLNLVFSQPIRRHLPFLPRENVERVPFKSTRLADILTHFSVKPDSLEARVMKESIGHCESPGIQNEQKYCATSLESMVDHCISKLGKNIQALSTDVEKQTPLQSFTITEVQKIRGDKAVSCHPLLYVHPVFYCHNTNDVRLSKVSLVGEDGTKVNGVSICHTNSKHWNPDHLAFRMLKIKPGTDPVCHFLFFGHVLWTKN